MNINFLNIKLLVIIIFLSINLIKNVYSSENYVVTLVNKIPITKFDVVNRAKLIASSVALWDYFVQCMEYIVFHSSFIKTIVDMLVKTSWETFQYEATHFLDYWDEHDDSLRPSVKESEKSLYTCTT